MTIRQQHHFECGLCCALWVASRGNDRNISMQAARSQYAWAQSALSLGQVRQLLLQMGVSTTAVRAEPEQFKNYQLPAVVHWRHNHYIVLKKVYRDGRWLVFDPAKGELELSQIQVSECFTGVALINPIGQLNAAHDLQAEPTDYQLVDYTRPPITRSLFAWALVTVFVGQLCALALPMQMQWVIDHLSANNAFQTTASGIGMFLLLAMLLAGLGAVKDRLLIRMQVNAKAVMRQTCYQQVAGARTIDTGFSVGEVLSRFGAISELVRFAIASKVSLLADLVFLVIASLLMLWYYWPVALVCIVSVLLHLAISGMIMRRVRARAANDITASAQLNSLLASWASAPLGVRFGLGQLRSQTQWASSCDHQKNTEQATQQLLVSLKLITQLLRSCELAAVYVLLISAYTQQQITIGMITAMVAWRALMAVRSEAVVKYDQERRINHLYKSRLQEVLPSFATSGQITHTLSGRLSYKAATGDSLNNFSLAAGETLLINGASGAGKSHLLRMLLGIEPCLGARIHYDGVALHQLSDASIDDAVGWVCSSEPFSGQLIDNFGTQLLERLDTFMTLLAKLGLDEWFRALPLGVYTPLSDSGVRLSDGQRSRLSVARALFKKPTILILDEPLAHLDHASASLVINVLRSYKATQIWVHHGEQPFQFDHQRTVGRLNNDPKRHNAAS